MTNTGTATRRISAAKLQPGMTVEYRSAHSDLVGTIARRLDDVVFDDGATIVVFQTTAGIKLFFGARRRVVVLDER